ncbi:TPA: hypothetical protein RQ363_004887 [Klebsiella oxytoca]|uniref:hypothetical protein n=2 Tax=Klebsiella pneumoniae complex TaxID=3390273 RepID=UPI0011E88F0E|nr:hypothetical protein [Klebsiella pneumoniae]EKW3810657.1 hypothetical protein [Klebsiella pneumoniae]HDY3614463.1 hypothetical protein [Klebsiella oxytoca]
MAEHQVTQLTGGNSMGQTRTFEIMYPGSFTSSDGRKISFSARDLNEMAETYSPSRQVAPLTIGHPTDNKPDLGPVLSVFVYKERLHVTADFADSLFSEIQRGSYKNRSASFYLPDSPGNPTPGKMYLRHVGFLGAAAPAVKGLSPLNFASVNPSAPVDFASEATPVSFFDTNICDTTSTFPVKTPDGTTKQAFLWRGEVLYLPD